VESVSFFGAWTDFPDAVYLKERLFGLPVHQDLEEKHIDMAFNAFIGVFNEFGDDHV